jgi:paraquat-inducible protein B
MTMNENNNENPSETPDPGSGQGIVPPLNEPQVLRRRWNISPVWLVPILAALIGLSMLVNSWLSVGPKITVSLQTAAGLEAGKTLVKYKDVVIGNVSAITFSEDHSQVIVSITLDKSAEDFAREDTRFWVVRPRIGTSGISGIDTVFSGAYIGVDKGTSETSRKTFTGLETPPSVISGAPGRSFVVNTDDLGSLDIGSPVYYRRIQVGRISSYALNKENTNIALQVFIDAPYDRYVTSATSFWNASGIDVSLSAEGMKLNTQSLATVVAGGIAFATPDGNSTPAPDHTQFVLSKDQQTALSPPDGPAEYIEMRFDQSMRGLTVGAAVDFLGVNIGRVVSVNLDYNTAKQKFSVIVGAVVYPQRLGNQDKNSPLVRGNDQRKVAQFVGKMVAQGLRAQARTGNLLTGQLFIALDFVPTAPKVAFDINAKPLMMPTVGGTFDKVQEQVADIVNKMSKIPFDSIGHRLDGNLAELDKTLKDVNGNLLPEFKNTLNGAQQTLGTANSALTEGSPLQQNLSQTLLELQRAALSMRALTDQLSRHPEALIRGRQADAVSPSNPNSATSAKEK